MDKRTAQREIRKHLDAIEEILTEYKGSTNRDKLVAWAHGLSARLNLFRTRLDEDLPCEAGSSKKTTDHPSEMSKRESGSRPPGYPAQSSMQHIRCDTPATG